MEWLDKLPPEKRAVAEKVAAAARKHGVPVNLALGMAMQESAFDQSKRSGTGPVGVMQVSRTLGKEYKINPKNIDQNIDAGIRFMKRNLDKYGNVDDALVAYHDGPSSAYFKGGQMSPAAANHIMKVKGYAGMATDNKAAPETAFSTDIEDIAPVELMAEEAAVMGGRRPRDINDLMGGLAGAGIGYGIGKTREMSKHQKEMTLSAQRLALQQQRAEQEALDRAAETKKGPQFGSGTENWKNVEFGEPIARQIVNPLDKPSAARQGQAAVARHERASQLFPTQIPAGEGSLLTIPVTTGGSARVPMPAPEAPAPAAPTARPAGQQPAMGVLKAPGRVSTAATTGLGGLAGAQAYDTWQNIKEGNYPAAFQSGLSSVEAALAAGARNPKVKAITGGIAGATAFGPELVDYIREVLGSQPPVEQKAKGGLIGVPAKEGFAPYGLRHSGEGMKGHGYFGLLPSKEGISSEISVEDDSGEFPTMVPTLTQEELNHLLSGQDPTEEIYQKARSWADTRRARGQSPFAERGELQMPVPGFAGGGSPRQQIATAAAKAAWEHGGNAIRKFSDFAQNHIGKYFVPTQSDRMAGVGGSSYSANQLALPQYAGRAWGSGTQPIASGVANLARDPRFGGPENQIFAPILGSQNMHQSNQIVFDELMNEFYKNAHKMTPELRARINQHMQSGYPDKKGKTAFDPLEGFDIADRDMVAALASTFKNRGAIAAHAFGGEGIGKRKSQIIPFDEILSAHRDPIVANADTFSMGPRAFQLTGEVEPVPRPDLNSAFPWQLHGKDLNVTYDPVPSEFALPDYIAQWRADKNKPVTKSPGYFEYTLGYEPVKGAGRIYPRQQMTEEWIKELQRNGFAQGGLANI